MLPSMVPAGETLLTLIDEQAQRQQDRLAFQDRNTQVSHIETVRRANQIAHAILADTPSNSIVGILIPHSVHVAIAIIGVVKAGCAYVALDPSLPQTRLMELCADAGVRVLLTDAAHADLASQIAPNQTVKIIKIEDVGIFPTDVPSVTITPETPLALIYTSGSTGKPKGIMQYHGQMLQSIMEARQQANEKSRGLFISPFNVIGAITFVFGTLIIGGSLHLVDVTVEGLADIPARIQNEGITVYQSTPTIFRYWASQYRHVDLPKSPFPTLAIVSLSGEAVRSDDFELFKRIAPPMCLFINGFGATEIGGITGNMLFPSTKVQPGTLSAGPINPMRPILLLDENGQPVPEGQVGEIVVPVDAKTAGYWRDDELTAAKFKPHPTDPNMRLYYMGDLARIEDGMLYHVGRTDHQVKIRGVRIELGEVEAALNAHPAVQEAAAVAVNRPNAVTSVDEQVLVAFVVPNPHHPTPPEPNEIRAFLHDRLPDTSIPSRITVIDALPRVVGGKIDVRALQALDAQSSNAAPETTLARTREREAALTALWKQTLGVESIGLDDNFFALGGHSLTAAYLVSEMRVRFNMPITLPDFAAAPTLRGVLKATNTASVSPYLVPIREPVTPMRPPLFCFHLIRGLSVAYWRIAEHLGEGQPIYGLDAQGANNDLPPLDRLEDMAALYIREIRAVQPKSPYFLYGYSFGGLIAFEVARQLVAAGESVAFLGLLDTIFPGFERMPSQDERRTVFHRLQTGLSILQTLAVIPTRYKGWYMRRIAKSLLNRQQYDSKPPVDETPLPDHLKRIEMANYKAYFDYKIRPYTGKIDFFFAEGRHLDRRIFDMLQSLTTAGYTLREVSGSHFKLAQEPHVRSVAASLREALNDAVARTGL